MKYKLFFFLFFLISCVPNYTKLENRKPYNSKGFAYIYNDFDFDKKIIKGKMKNDVMQISQQNLRIGALIKIVNPKNNKTIVLKNIKKIRYPNFYKILITESVANELDLDINVPLLEIFEINFKKITSILIFLINLSHFY